LAHWRISVAFTGAFQNSHHLSYLAKIWQIFYERWRIFQKLSLAALKKTKTVISQEYYH